MLFYLTNIIHSISMMDPKNIFIRIPLEKCENINVHNTSIEANQNGLGKMIFLWRNICFSKQNIINVQQIYCCISLWLWANDLRIFFSSYIYECVVVWYKQKWEKVIVYFLYPITRQIYRRSSSIMNFHILPSYLFYVLKLLQCSRKRKKLLKEHFCLSIFDAIRSRYNGLF